MNILRVYPLLSVVTILLPILGGVVTAFLGWENLKNKHEDDLFRVDIKSSNQDIIQNQMQLKNEVTDKKGKEILKSVIKKKISNLRGNATSLIYHMGKSVGIEIDSDALISEEQLIEICSKVYPKSNSFAMNLHLKRHATWLEIMILFKEESKVIIDDLLRISQYLEPGTIKTLNEIESSPYFMMLGYKKVGLPYNNRNFDTLEPALYEYLILIEKLRPKPK